MSMAEGRIQKALSGFYYVDTGAEVLTCRARGKFRKEGQSPLVGDRVEVRELGNGEGFVEAILPRKNDFSRPAVANIDQLVVIGSANCTAFTRLPGSRPCGSARRLGRDWMLWFP